MWEDKLEAFVAWMMIVSLAAIATISAMALGGLIE